MICLTVNCFGRIWSYLPWVLSESGHTIFPINTNFITKPGIRGQSDNCNSSNRINKVN